MKTIVRPSGLKELGKRGCGLAASAVSAPLPSAGFWYMFMKPLRNETKAIVLPSGDQIGKSLVPSKVSRVNVSRSISYIQMSPATRRAAFLPSGETLSEV